MKLQMYHVALSLTLGIIVGDLFGRELISILYGVAGVHSQLWAWLAQGVCVYVLWRIMDAMLR